METRKRKVYETPSSEKWYFAAAELMTTSFGVRDFDNDNDDSEGAYVII